MIFEQKYEGSQGANHVNIRKNIPSYESPKFRGFLESMSDMFEKWPGSHRCWSTKRKNGKFRVHAGGARSHESSYSEVFEFYSVLESHGKIWGRELT